MKKKGFATSAILYTMLLLFLVLMTSILNNLQNKKTILDQLKVETINALNQDTIIDSLLEQIGLLKNQVTELQGNVKALQEENSTYLGYIRELQSHSVKIENGVPTVVGHGNALKTYYLKTDIDSTKSESDLLILYESIPNTTMFEIIVSAASIYRITGFKANSLYGYMEKQSYYGKIQSRQLYNGTWTNWQTYN